MIGLGGGDFLGEIEAFEAGKGVEFGQNRAFVEMAGRFMSDDAVRHTVFADPRGQSAGVDAGDADDVALLEPGVELFSGAVVRRIGDVGLENDAADARQGGHVHRLDVFVIGADIADMGKGEGDDLAGIGGVGEDFLVAGHGRVEADFAGGMADCTDAMALKARAVSQNKNCGRGGLLPAGHGGSPCLVRRFARRGGGGKPLQWVRGMSVEASS